MATKRPTTVPKMKGVEALLSPQPRVERETASSTTIAIGKIKLPDKQPRRYFDPERQAQLVQSVQEHGILEPLLVRPLSNGEYELVAGERRLRAAQELELQEVPIVARPFDDRQALQVALMENLQREDLNPVEETEGVLELLAIALEVSTEEVKALLHQGFNAKRRNLELTGNVTSQLQMIDQVLTAVGRFTAESFRSNRLPLLNLPSNVLDALRQGQLEYTKARVIARIKDGRQRSRVLRIAISENLSLSEIKHKVQQVQARKPEVEQDDEHVEFHTRATEILRQFKQKQIWTNSKKRQKAERLLAELEKLIMSDP
jgi:ParB family transcriptional regulator, chromosome partitioning protein